jgi:hypothetical protein
VLGGTLIAIGKTKTVPAPTANVSVSKYTQKYGPFFL